MRSHPGECLHIDVSDEFGESFYTVWVCNEIIPAVIRVAVAGRALTLLELASVGSREADAGKVLQITTAIAQASEPLCEFGHPRQEALN